MQKTQFFAGPAALFLGLGIRKYMYLPQKMGPTPFRSYFKMGPALFASLLAATRYIWPFSVQKPLSAEHRWFLVTFKSYTP